MIHRRCFIGEASNARSRQRRDLVHLGSKTSKALNLTSGRRMTERLGISSQAYSIYFILAEIADERGQENVAQDYWRRGRKVYASLEANRYNIDESFGDIIKAIAAGARGDEQAKAEVEDILPQWEEDGYRIADATHRIWAGERDWHVLADDRDIDIALLILLRVLQAIEEQ